MLVLERHLSLSFPPLICRSTSMPRQPQQKQERIPSLALFSLAILHSHFCWVCSAIWTLCTINLSSAMRSYERIERVVVTSTKTEPACSSTSQSNNNTTAVTHTMNITVAAARRRRGRPRGFSEPPVVQPSSRLVGSTTAKRTRGQTISAGISADDSGNNNFWAKRFLYSFNRHLRYSNTSSSLSLALSDITDFRPTLMDERRGTTCPPVWLQKARFYMENTRRSFEEQSNATRSLEEQSEAIKSLEEQSKTTSQEEENVRIERISTTTTTNEPSDERSDSAISFTEVQTQPGEQPEIETKKPAKTRPFLRAIHHLKKTETKQGRTVILNFRDQFLKTKRSVHGDHVQPESKVSVAGPVKKRNAISSFWKRKHAS